MKTLGEVLQLSVQYLQDRHISRPKRVAEELLAFLLSLKRIDLYMQFDRPMEEEELKSYRELLKRKGGGEPLDYLLREKTFFYCSLEISPAVLIPRQETEILLSKASDSIKCLPWERKVAWDLCTGSGCLGIGLKKAFPSLRVSLSDISLQALEVAKKNSERNQVEVELYQGDLLAPFKGKKADFILCNPPYVSDQEFLELDREVRDFEPRLALVAGPTGLEFYHRLARELPLYLNAHGKVFLEIGTGQGPSLMDLFSETHWRVKKLEKDWAGHDRFFFLEIE